MHWLTKILAARGRTQAEFAKAIDVASSRVSEMKNRGWSLPLKKVPVAAEFLGLTEAELVLLITNPDSEFAKKILDWVERGGTDLDVPDTYPSSRGVLSPRNTEGLIEVKRYDARLSAGPGSLVNGDEELGMFPFDEQWLRSLTTTTPDFLAVVMVDGDSMEATLSDRDLILIDRSQHRIGREGLYALRVGDFCWIKRLSLNLRDRMIRIISDNPRYPVQELPEDEVAILGRAVSIVARRL
ncbi:LexA family transcriptional regulator [Oceanibaculum nanhaiense]|uniref:LexA family transcriptional regulator n=1 Tax=Oceanibaculum nanhaiense TaxID=1909734 RepID=UPI003D2B4BBB